MLFLGITSPKKEIFLGTYGDSLGVPILHGVGGSFDVLAGVTKRAPVHWQRWGLEWAYRTLQEPRRMWKRYLTTNTRFLILLAREVIHPTPAYPVNRLGLADCHEDGHLRGPPIPARIRTSGNSYSAWTQNHQCRFIGNHFD